MTHLVNPDSFHISRPVGSVGKIKEDVGGILKFKRILASGGVASLLVIASLVNGASANAWSDVQYFGYNDCGSKYAQTQTVGKGEKVHQIFVRNGSYVENRWNDGAAVVYHALKSPWHYSTDATIGMTPRNTTAWTCAA